MRAERSDPSASAATEIRGGPGLAPRLLRLESFADQRGRLSAAELGKALPFEAVRYFLVHEVPADAIRAQHAQRSGEELLSCVVGSCTVETRWGNRAALHRLDDPRTALHVPPMVWVECRDFSTDAVLLALCSRPYDPANAITDFETFRAEADTET